MFLNRDGEVTIVGEHRGEWADGVWYSNSGWRPPVRRRKKRRPARPRRLRPVSHRRLFDTDTDPYQNVWDDNTPTTSEQLREAAHRILEERPQPEQWTSDDCFVIAAAYRA